MRVRVKAPSSHCQDSLSPVAAVQESMSHTTSTCGQSGVSTGSRDQMPCSHWLLVATHRRHVAEHVHQVVHLEVARTRLQSQG